ncbi:hypothetical protein BKA63DRAFT_90280 [Paraphoma chrysanthemicola]|nr:hypothetical protein BKA63DRAFT_90280 [Paraphoma chrysanthemicola]
MLVSLIQLWIFPTRSVGFKTGVHVLFTTTSPSQRLTSIAAKQKHILLLPAWALHPLSPVERFISILINTIVFRRWHQL